MFQLSSYRIAGEEESTINIADLTANLWLVTEYESDGSSSTTTSTLHSEIFFLVEANTISFSVPKSLHIAIQAISQATPISVESVYSFGEQGHERDSFPDLTNYTVGVDTSLLNDTIGDVNDAASEIIDGNTIVDIVEVSITVTD